MRARPSHLAMAIVLAAAAPITPPQASAQGMVVHDPANVAQNVLQAARALEQVNNQITQIEQQVRMLRSLDLQLAPEVTQTISAARELFGQAQAIRYNLGSIATEIRTLYPDDYRSLSLDDMLRRSDAWVAESRASVERLVAQQARAAQGLNRTETQINRALTASGAAEGQTSAIQASNQMLGVLSAQLAEMQALQIAQSRALAAERLERAAREERALEIQRRAFPTTRAAPPPPARTAF
jgi:type IV secretion system protein TrbJ